MILPIQRLHKVTLIAVIGIAALSLWIIQQRRLHSARQSLEQMNSTKATLQAGIEQATAALDSVRHEWVEQEASRKEAAAGEVKVRRELARVDSDARWGQPPEHWPEWNTNSPYVWISKATLSRAASRVFDSHGGLNADTANLFGIDQASLRSLNTKLETMLSDYHTLQVTKAECTAGASGGPDGDGPKVTVRIPAMPDESKSYRQQLQATLLDTLGQQRTDLLMPTIESWMEYFTSNFGAEESTISVTRHGDGTYRVEEKSASSSSCADGGSTIGNRVPAYLLPLFTNIGNTSGASQ